MPQNIIFQRRVHCQLFPALTSELIFPGRFLTKMSLFLCVSRYLENVCDQLEKCSSVYLARYQTSMFRNGEIGKHALSHTANT